MTQQGMDPVEALRRVGAVCDGSTLRALCDPWRIRVAVRDGRIVRLAHNRYALPELTYARAAAARVSGTASHTSAALLWGWKVKWPPRLPAVTVAPNRNLPRHRRGGIDVKWQHLTPGEVSGMVTSRVRTVIDGATPSRSTRDSASPTPRSGRPG